jgi:VIT1/CCC1 family predicted Fe2+/Mn2+ transporter
MNAASMSGPDASTPDDRSLRRWRRHLADEREEAAVYRNLAARRDGEEREILLELADAEERHIAHWERLLGDHEGPRRRGDLRTRLLATAARRFGSVFVLAQLPAEPTVTAGEEDGRADSDVVDSGLGAALSSFLFFASGAVVPVLPFLFGMTGADALVLATVLVGLSLMLTGAIVGVLSGGPPLRRALRQLAVGAVAAAVTYGLGLLFGATLG